MSISRIKMGFQAGWYDPDSRASGERPAIAGVKAKFTASELVASLSFCLFGESSQPARAVSIQTCLLSLVRSADGARSTLIYVTRFPES